MSSRIGGSSDDETQTLRPRYASSDYGAVSTSTTTTDTQVDADGEEAQLLSKAGPVEPNPLDMKQITLLSMARISEPLTFGILFPFVQQMIVDTGEVSVEDVGYSVGLIEISFSITQSLSLLYWARAADKWGRKPVLIASLFGALASTALFGFSNHVWQMYACRFLAGVFGGNAMVIRTLFTENCDPTNQATAFAYFAFAANMGALIGPTVGGVFAEPAKQWPNTFGHIQLFVNYPYSLPCLVCALYCLVSMVLCALWLKETRPDECDNPMPVRSILKPRMIKMLAIFGWTVTVVFSQGALFPLYLFTPISLGGQGKAPPKIAQLQAAAGLAQGLWLLIVLPRLDRWLGTKKTFKLVSAGFPIVMVLPIIANALARQNSTVGAHLILGAYVGIGTSCNMTFTSVQLLLNSLAPPGAIATVNGIAVAICGIVKSIFPAVINSIFALSVSHDIMGGYLAWVIMSIMAAGVFVCALLAPDNSPLVESASDQKNRVTEAEAEEVMEGGRF
ncbi:hypothetical protein CI109_102180 [Kwoniella shandongensis]|uniref:Uncharacterized protein n=1 Tax=Kwoniella shandongensis TaxID=1734106 RepID=A0A5M6BYV1_9TREE|nr:uncharacterized protein CI109_003661 [Kwoniella shandongensis]KAA5528006.1 hypothetical protein CI109_003661 [Kwoniella shandongensis]